MDVRHYFRKIREIEAALADEYPIVVSVETPDGGKAGMLSEVSRLNAAKMLVEGKASLATEEQKKQYLQQIENTKKTAEQADLTRRLHLSIIEDPTLQAHLASRRSNNPSGSGK